MPGKALLKSLVTRETQSQMSNGNVSATAVSNGVEKAPTPVLPSYQWADVSVLCVLSLLLRNIVLVT